MKNNYVVYMHINKINNKKYIGITSREANKRWENGKGYVGQVFGLAIDKYGWDNFEHIIIAEKINQDAAFKMEQDLIKKYKTTNKIYGYNRSSGGESGSYQSYNVQFKRMTAVYQYSMNGSFIKEFISIEEAKRCLGVKGGNISACCNGYRKVAHGYRWFKEFKGEKIEKLEDRMSRIIKSESKEIYQYSIDGCFIKKYNSISDAKRELDCKGINACVLGKSLTSAGYRWFNEYKGDKIESCKGHYTQIAQCDTNGNVLHIFESVVNASNELGISGYLIKKHVQNGLLLDNKILKYVA